MNSSHLRKVELNVLWNLAIFIRYSLELVVLLLAIQIALGNAINKNSLGQSSKEDEKIMFGLAVPKIAQLSLLPGKDKNSSLATAMTAPPSTTTTEQPSTTTTEPPSTTTTEPPSTTTTEPPSTTTTEPPATTTTEQPSTTTTEPPSTTTTEPPSTTTTEPPSTTTTAPPAPTATVDPTTQSTDGTSTNPTDDPTSTTNGSAKASSYLSVFSFTSTLCLIIHLNSV